MNDHCIEGYFEFLQHPVYTERDGFDQYVMHKDSGMVFGLGNNNLAKYISTQKWEPDMLGSRGGDVSAIREYSHATGIGTWDY